MIFLTGDTHGDIRRLNTESFYEQKEMTKDDYLIILGDFGLVWDYKGESKYEKHWLDWLENKPFTTLFIDGNHENHDRLDSYEVEEWHRGKVHKIRPSVIHLMRGQVFEIDGLKVFTFGGASSHDISDGILELGDPRIVRWSKDYTKLFRVNKISWWDRELPSVKEMEEGRKNLEKNDWNVDFVLTHCAPTGITAVVTMGDHDQNDFTEYLQEIMEKLTYKKWFFGHYHMNKVVYANEICLYEQIVRLN